MSLTIVWFRRDLRLADHPALTAAAAAGHKIKINAVALKGVNDDEIHDMVAWCGDRGFDLTFIEVMPLGEIGGEARLDGPQQAGRVASSGWASSVVGEGASMTGGSSAY